MCFSEAKYVQHSRRGWTRRTTICLSPNNTLLFYAALGNIRCFRQLYYNIGLRFKHMLVKPQKFSFLKFIF